MNLDEMRVDRKDSGKMTTQMDKQEERELDAWICVNLFGRKDVWWDAESGISWDANKRIPPNYTTDPAAALEVLKRCARKAKQIGCHIRIQESGRGNQYLISLHNEFGEMVFTAVAQTFELCVCRFAKQLFS